MCCLSIFEGFSVFILKRKKGNQLGDEIWKMLIEKNQV